jgi:membrane-bound ClpP family serine protease
MLKIQSLKIFFTLLLLLFNNPYFCNEKDLLVVEVNGEINKNTVLIVKNAIEQADMKKTSNIIFHIDTFGGFVYSAFEIRDLIIKSGLNTIAYVDTKAISAGALIALSCKKIYMAPGSIIGASTVVNMYSGEKESEKYQSIMRSTMRSTAEINNRRPDIAEGMVDETISIDGITEYGKLITLTSDEAIKYKMADSILLSISEIPILSNDSQKVTKSNKLLHESSQKKQLSQTSDQFEILLIILLPILLLAIIVGLIIKKNTSRDFNSSNKPILLLTNTFNNQTFTLYEKRKIILGRSKSCDLVLNSNFISDQHAEIVVNKKNIIITDLNSKNGLLLNNKSIGTGELKNGDIIKIGEIQLKVKIKI